MPWEKDTENSGGRIRFREASVRKKCCLKPEASVRWARENEEAGSVAGRRKACVKAQIKPVHPKGNQPWVFIRRTDAEAEAPILWPSDAKSWLIGKDLDAGKDWGQEEKQVTENDMAGWHHWLKGHEFEQTPGDGEGQESLACCIPWGHKESDRTEYWTTKYIILGQIMLDYQQFIVFVIE